MSMQVLHRIHGMHYHNYYNNVCPVYYKVTNDEFELYFKAAIMELRSYIFVFVALSYLDFATSDVRYVLPSAKAATCPSANNCFILSHVAENSFTLISGLNTTLLFLPGNHTLTSSLMISNLSSFVMIANKHLPRPVINCEQQAMFCFISIAYVRINGISLNGCLNNISLVDEFIMEDRIILGNRIASRRALFVIDSSIRVVGSQFESSTEVIYLLQSSSRISHCTFSNNTALTKGEALHIGDWCNITIEHSTFFFHACYTVRSCEGAVLYSKHSELLITNYTFDNNRDGAIVVFRSKVRIIDSYLSGNIARHGAAIQVLHGSFVLISDTHFCYNEVDYDYYKLKVYTISTPGGAVNCCTCITVRSKSHIAYLSTTKPYICTHTHAHDNTSAKIAALEAKLRQMEEEDMGVAIGVATKKFSSRPTAQTKRHVTGQKSTNNVRRIVKPSHRTNRSHYPLTWPLLSYHCNF